MQIAIVDEVRSSDPNNGMHVRDGGANRDFRVMFQEDEPDGFNFWVGRTIQNDEGDDAFVELTAPQAHLPANQVLREGRAST